MFSNSFIKKFSWVLLFSLVFSLFSVLPEEPVYAAGEFDCNDSDGRGYAFQSTWSSSTLTITRGSNNSSNSWSTSTLQTYSSFDGLGTEFKSVKLFHKLIGSINLISLFIYIFFCYINLTIY